MEKPSDQLAVAVMGLGDIGRGIVRAALASEEVVLVGAVDSDPRLIGKPLAELVPGAPAILRVEGRFEMLMPRLRGGVLLLATSSRLDDVLPLIEKAVRAGVHVVSTCEELTFPWLTQEERADRLNDVAMKHDVSVLGIGVNPGFVFDRLVATAGAVCGRIRSVRASRVVDVTTRRPALQRKAGVGLTEEEFERKLDTGEVGLPGMAEAAALCVLGLGLEYDELEEEILPILAEEDLDGAVPVKRGQVAGIFQRARGFLEGQEVVDLELTLSAGVDEVFDHIHLDAEPPVDLRIKGGYAGDAATAWAVVNAAPKVAKAEAGILTVLELPAGR